MDELVGYRCTIIFEMEACKWPIPGYPAFAVVKKVDMPMIKLDNIWVNVNCIRSIQKF